MKIWALVSAVNAIGFGIGLLAVTLTHWQADPHFVAIAAFYGGTLSAIAALRKELNN